MEMVQIGDNMYRVVHRMAAADVSHDLDFDPVSIFVERDVDKVIMRQLVWVYGVIDKSYRANG